VGFSSAYSVQAGSAGNATHSDVNVQYGRKK